MRLINADRAELYDAIGRNAFKTRDDIRNLIDMQPTIHAELIVEAEWIDKPSGRYGRWQSWCSACGEHNRIGGIESNRHRPRCPHCGARMKNGG